MESAIVSTEESNDVLYEFTATTFRKTSKLPFADTRPDGTPFIWARSWNHERIANEAKALRLVSERTTIPVPRLLDHGVHEDGRQYLVTELIEGEPLSEFDKRPCSRPIDEAHTKSIPCEICLKEAYANALEFINGVVFPQLSQLKTQQRGIDGFIMPPCWLSPDTEPPFIGMPSWKTLPLGTPGYVFQHGDLAAHNILVDPKMLRVKSLIDWEYDGFFPEGMELWPGTLDRGTYYKRAQKLADAIANFLPDDYIQCYEAWKDKAQLEELIEQGKIPHPSACKKS